MALSSQPHFIELAEVYLNLDQVAFVRKEDHAQMGTVVAVHFAAAGLEPLYVGERHFDELRSLLRGEEARAGSRS
jgi:hypothetical protein